jgi:16S rRNA G966 N2-methylase RsmD
MGLTKDRDDASGAVGGYYGSQLNKYLHNLSKEMTVINLDCLQYKASQKKIRIIESKYKNESVGNQQRKVLQILADVTRSNNYGYTVGVYIIYGNPPYNDGAIIENLTLGKTKEVNKEQLDKWLQFK